ncbi:hypothetical protein ACWAUC_11995 [Bradyrhizobium guangdongense]
MTIFNILDSQGGGHADAASVKHGGVRDQQPGIDPRPYATNGRASDLDIFSHQKLVIRESGRWRITEIVRTFVATLEAAAAMAREDQTPEYLIERQIPSEGRLLPTIRGRRNIRGLVARAEQRTRSASALVSMKSGRGIC